MRVIYVTHFDPVPVGHGGIHRTYQVFNELEGIAGQGNVTIVKVWLQWWKRRPNVPGAKPAATNLMDKVERNRHEFTSASFYMRPLRRVRHSVRSRIEVASMALGNYVDNPLKLLAKTDYTTRSCSSPRFLSNYEKTLERIHPDVCVIEHTSFADLIPLNKKRGIPTICCPQNLEAFDLMPLDGKWSLNSTALDFANEIRVLATCDERLFISQVETALVSGLGIPARYYPYVPAGEIRDQYMQIRAERSARDKEPGLFVMMGSAEHDTTREGFLWILEQIETHGLPRGARFVICGSATETLLPETKKLPGVELRGWVEQTELRDLLLRAQAMLIPQHRGFGALTRLPEFACAGIQVIVSRHPTYALDVPPGVRVVEDEWGEWLARLRAVMAEPQDSTLEDYTCWEMRQPRTLSNALLHLCLKPVDDRKSEGVLLETTGA